jgi:hypothetical protein
VRPHNAYNRAAIRLVSVVCMSLWMIFWSRVYLSWIDFNLDDLPTRMATFWNVRPLDRSILLSNYGTFRD